MQVGQTAINHPGICAPWILGSTEKKCLFRLNTFLVNGKVQSISSPWAFNQGTKINLSLIFTRLRLCLHTDIQHAHQCVHLEPLNLTEATVAERAAYMKKIFALFVSSGVLERTVWWRLWIAQQLNNKRHWAQEFRSTRHGCSCSRWHNCQ